MMKRFSVFVSDYHGSGCYDYERAYCEDGEYVDADEALAEIEKLRAQLATAESILDAFRRRCVALGDKLADREAEGDGR